MKFIFLILTITFIIVYLEFRIRKHEKKYHTINRKKKNSDFINKVNEIYYSVGKDS